MPLDGAGVCMCVGVCVGGVLLITVSWEIQPDHYNAILNSYTILSPLMSVGLEKCTVSLFRVALLISLKQWKTK